MLMYLQTYIVHIDTKTTRLFVYMLYSEMLWHDLVWDCVACLGMI